MCNIPVIKVDANYNMLPRQADSNGLLIVKFKRKLEYKGHIVFEQVRPALVLQFLEFLKSHSHLYSYIEINTNNIPVDVLGCQNEKLEENEIFSQLLTCLDKPTDVKIELSTGEEIKEDPLSEFRAPSVETRIISEIPSACELEQETHIALGEGKQPASVLSDKFFCGTCSFSSISYW